jgi:hypothetical protein
MKQLQRWITYNIIKSIGEITFSEQAHLGFPQPCFIIVHMDTGLTAVELKDSVKILL